MKLGFVITNDKTSYVAKGDTICLFINAEETDLKNQQKKPFVPLKRSSNCQIVMKVTVI